MLLQVSWLRHRDTHLLTVGRYTYTSDQRFRAIHHPHSEDWILQIKYPQHRDSGIYECQISTTPHMSHFIHLNVIGKFIKKNQFIERTWTSNSMIDWWVSVKWRVLLKILNRIIYLRNEWIFQTTTTKKRQKS